MILDEPLFSKSKIMVNKIIPHKVEHVLENFKNDSQQANVTISYNSVLKFKNNISLTTNSTDICKSSKNPCQNNGTCIWNKNIQGYYCECTPGFTNDNCTELIGNIIL